MAFIVHRTPWKRNARKRRVYQYALRLMISSGHWREMDHAYRQSFLRTARLVRNA